MAEINPWGLCMDCWKVYGNRWHPNPSDKIPDPGICPCCQLPKSGFTLNDSGIDATVSIDGESPRMARVWFYSDRDLADETPEAEKTQVEKNRDALKRAILESLHSEESHTEIDRPGRVDLAPAVADFLAELSARFDDEIRGTRK